MVKILVDSASDIDKNEADKLGIELISIPIRFGDTEYADGVDLGRREFFEKLIESDELPQTSQINVNMFEERFEKILGECDELVAIVLSSRLSGTYDNACQAASRFGDRVHVVDSLNASAGERILCLYAIELLKRGLSAKQIAAELNEKKKQVRFLALLDTLEYLKRGGRVSSAVAFAGELFSIKPVVSVADGEVKLVGKAIGSKRGSNLLTRFIDEYGVDYAMPIALVYSGLSDDLLTKYVEDSKRLWAGKIDSLPHYLIGSTIGTHIGPGAIGVAFFAQ